MTGREQDVQGSRSEWPKKATGGMHQLSQMIIVLLFCCLTGIHNKYIYITTGWLQCEVMMMYVGYQKRQQQTRSIMGGNSGDELRKEAADVLVRAGVDTQGYQE